MNKLYNKDSERYIRSFPEFRNLSESDLAELLSTPRQLDKDEIEHDKQVLFDSDKHQILNQIFALDPITKLPSGDYAQFLSQKTSPEVRDYIRTQLLSRTPDTPSMPDDMSDELFEFQRLPNEDKYDYVARIQNLIKDKNASKT